MTTPRTLSAPVTVAFDYTRSTGPVLGRFLGGLRARRVYGGRLGDGRVVVPPPEFDPVSHAALDPEADLVEVGSAGTVTSWSWVPEPVAGQPFDRPFAWALVTLDGSDSPLLHALDVTTPGEVSTGMRVRVRWCDQRQGAITDIACFEPDSRPQPEGWEPDPAPEGPVDRVVTSVSLDYLYAASPEESRFYGALAQGRILGQRCPACGKVYVPPRGACPTDGVPTTDEVELPGRGTVTTFCIVNVPFLGQRIQPPYVSAYVLLDGADIALQHLVQEVDAAEVRMGMRVEAVWRPRREWTTSIENIRHFRPTGEPDADFETYRKHL